MPHPERVHDGRHSRGILTAELREKMENGELSGNDRFRIRTWIKNTLFADAGLLADPDTFEWRDREQIFAAEPREDESTPHSDFRFDPDILDGVADAIEFLFLGLARRGMDWETAGGEHHIPEFDEALETALIRAYEKHQIPVEGVDLRVRTERNRDMGPEETATLIEYMEPLPEWAIENAIRKGWIDKGDLREFVTDQIRTNTD